MLFRQFIDLCVHGHISIQFLACDWNQVNYYESTCSEHTPFRICTSKLIGSSGNRYTQLLYVFGIFNGKKFYFEALDVKYSFEYFFCWPLLNLIDIS